MPASRVDYCLAGLLLASSGGAWSADAAEEADALPEMELLEYLGSWEGSDEEWMLFAGEDDTPRDATDRSPSGKESVEAQDER